MALLDDNAVPRFHRRLSHEGSNFRRLPDGRYSLSLSRYKYVELYDKHLRYIKTVHPRPPLNGADGHDFLVTEEGNYLFMDYVSASRDVCKITTCDAGEERIETVRDSWIQEMTPNGTKLFEWNSWDHLKLSDCMLGRFRDDYAHLNSLQVVDGDIIASFRHCNTVVRIDRSGGTGALEWQVGGTSPPRNSATAYLTITGDTKGEGEFCGQHHATLTAGGSLVLFDNGNFCRGLRKSDQPFSRVVEYRLNVSGKEAVFQRQHLLPDGHGYSYNRGGVQVLPNGNWLIAWGKFENASLPDNQRLSISEVDPRGSAVLNLNMYSIRDRAYAFTYRVYRESGIEIPWNLP